MKDNERSRSHDSPSFGRVVYIGPEVSVEAERIGTVQIEEPHVVPNLAELDDLGRAHAFARSKTDASQIEPCATVHISCTCRFDADGVLTSMYNVVVVYNMEGGQNLCKILLQEILVNAVSVALLRKLFTVARSSRRPSESSSRS